MTQKILLRGILSKVITTGGTKTEMPVSLFLLGFIKSKIGDCLRKISLWCNAIHKVMKEPMLRLSFLRKVMK